MASILVVDDDYALRRALRRFLEADGHDVCEAADGVAALAVLEKNVVELVVTDQTMPRMNGLDLIRRMQQSSPDTKVVAISALEDAVHLAAREPNVRVALRKPFGLDEFSFALQSVLGAGVGLVGNWNPC